jgi:hypothetical protein
MKQKANAIRDGTNKWQRHLIKFLQDKNGNPSLREIVVLISLVCVLISWIGQHVLRICINDRRRMFWVLFRTNHKF